MIDMKYYFVTYQARVRRDDYIPIWNDVIDTSPMEFIKKVARMEEEGSNNYFDFVVISAIEISKEEFEEFDGYF